MDTNMPTSGNKGRFKPPFDGTIIISDLQRVLRDDLRILTDIPPEELLETTFRPPQIARFSRSLRILSKPLVTEAVTYSDEIHSAGDRVHRLMGVLHFNRHYAEGFMLEVFGTDTFKAMNKKIRRIQNLLDGFGAPPFELSLVHDVAPRFVAENTSSD